MLTGPAGDIEPPDLRYDRQVGLGLPGVDGPGGREQEGLHVEEPRSGEDVAEPVDKDLYLLK